MHESKMYGGPRSCRHHHDEPTTGFPGPSGRGRGHRGPWHGFAPGGPHGHPGHGGRGRASFLEPAVLAALMRAEAHGYDLRKAISEMTEEQLVVDPGGLYRTLRKLEDGGYLNSRWIEGESGPLRREYELTKAGRDLAAEWGSLLRARARTTSLLADALEEVTSGATSSNDEAPADTSTEGPAKPEES